MFGIELVDDHYGIIVACRKGRKRYDFPLVDLKVKAFDEIHTNTFVRYNFEIIAGSSSEKSELFISVIDNSEENTAIIERVYKDKNSLH